METSRIDNPAVEKYAFKKKAVVIHLIPVLSYPSVPWSYSKSSPHSSLQLLVPLPTLSHVIGTSGYIEQDMCYYNKQTN